MDIVGHTNVREHLNRMVALSVAPQSFLFSGPQRLGKFRVAYDFARKLSGGEKAGMDTNEDILVIGRQSGNGIDEVSQPTALSVADIRQAEVFLSRFPRIGTHRVLIIDEADRLTVSAANALLKVLEEPNSSSVIILVTHLPGKLLPTVRSRLFTLSFDLLSGDELGASFPNTKMPDFFFSLGLPGLVIEAIRHPSAFEEYKELLSGLFGLSGLIWTERLSLAERLADQAESLPGILELWIIGLERQWSRQSMSSLAFALFLESALETLDQISTREGNPRLLLEKLFTQA